MVILRSYITPAVARGAVTRTSALVAATLYLEGHTMQDYEDITIGTGPVPGQDYIYLGDFGNNNYDRDVVQIYRFPEPTVTQLR